jgi:hypothetical protein
VLRFEKMKTQTPDRAMRIKQFLKSRLSAERRAAVRKYFGRVVGFFFRDDLRMLALIHGSDKFGTPNITCIIFVQCGGRK